MIKVLGDPNYLGNDIYSATAVGETVSADCRTRHQADIPGAGPERRQ